MDGTGGELLDGEMCQIWVRNSGEEKRGVDFGETACVVLGSSVSGS